MRRLILIFVFTSVMVFADSIIVYSQPFTWYKTWGIPSRVEDGKSVVQTFDGGYAQLVIVSYGGANDYFCLLKYNYLGNFQWIKIIIDTTSRMFWDMQQTSDSGFILAGWSSGALLVKTDRNGNLKWQKNYTNLNSGTKLSSVKQTQDNGYIACGYYTDYVVPSTKGIVIKVDSLGLIQWEKQYMDSLHNGYGEIIQGYDRKYYVSGATKNNYPDVSHAILKKLDSTGNVIWNNIFYNNGSGQNIVQLKDGSLIVGGPTYNTSYQPIIAKFDTLGNNKWVRFYPSPVMFYSSMCKDIYDNIIISGGQGLLGTISNWKFDTSGTIIRIKNLSFSGYSNIASSCIKPTSDTGFIISGNAFISSINNADALIIKTDSAFNAPLITKIYNINSSIPEKFELYQNYPNPFNPVTKINYSVAKQGLVTLKIYDILGREIKTLVNEVKSPGAYIVDFNGSSLASGVYFYKIQSGDFMQVKRMVLIK